MDDSNVDWENIANTLNSSVTATQCRLQWDNINKKGTAWSKVEVRFP
jgi:hypothetical protein